jgi:hypothetical protein
MTSVVEFVRRGKGLNSLFPASGESLALKEQKHQQGLRALDPVRAAARTHMVRSRCSPFQKMRAQCAEDSVAHLHSLKGLLEQPIAAAPVCGSEKEKHGWQARGSSANECRGT